MANLEQFIQNMINMCNEIHMAIVSEDGDQRITIVQAPS